MGDMIAARSADDTGRVTQCSVTVKEIEKGADRSSTRGRGARRSDDRGSKRNGPAQMEGQDEATLVQGLQTNSKVQGPLDPLTRQ